MVFSVPMNAAIARVLKRMQEKQMKNRDKRTRMMSELLNNIKSIKLYAWENAFIRRILEVRNHQELKMLKKIGIATVCTVHNIALTAAKLLSNLSSPWIWHYGLGFHVSFIISWCKFNIHIFCISSGCLQLLCGSSSDIFYSFNIGHHLPSDFSLHAFAIPSRNGKY